MRNFFSRAFLFGLASVMALTAKSADPYYRQLSDLPTLYIETENKVSIPSKQGDYVRAVITLVDGDKVTKYEELGIRGRGNSTWNLAKKPYRIKFDSKQEFLGKDRAKAKSWTLLANHTDKTLMRNAVASAIGTFAGQPFTAAAEFVDLVLNGEYRGNYQISDQMEVRKKRVDITEQEEPGMTEADNITGGYFLEVDGFATQETSYFKTNKGVLITIKSPDEEIISKAQTNYIRNYINDFEKALFSSDFKDPEKGYRAYVDESTLASWYISSELTANVDCFWSTNIYKDKDDPKIYWGPLWDYDIAFNNCYRKGDISNGLMVDIAFSNNLTEVWVRQMYKDPWFVNMINRHWKELVAKGIEQYVLNYIDETARLLEKSQQLNFQMWPIYQRTYDELMLFSTYSEGVDFLKKFVTNRVKFLTSAFENEAEKIGPDPTTPPDPVDPDPTDPTDPTDPDPTDPTEPDPTEPTEPTPDFFTVDSKYYYTIKNAGVGSYVDVDKNSGLCIWTPTDERRTQHWHFVMNGNGYYQIVNRESGLAAADLSKKSGPTYNSGTQIILVDPDINDPRQLWLVTPVSNRKGAGLIFVNLETGLLWNNNGGDKKDGNRIISWISDIDNTERTSRQWSLTNTYIEYDENDIVGGGDDGENDGINDAVADVEYMVTYEKSIGMLHFRTIEGQTLDGVAAILSYDGKELMKFRPEENVDISALPEGYYILTWQTANKSHTVKFAR